MRPLPLLVIGVALMLTGGALTVLGSADLAGGLLWVVGGGACMAASIYRRRSD